MGGKEPENGEDMKEEKVNVAEEDEEVYEQEDVL